MTATTLAVPATRSATDPPPARLVDDGPLVDLADKSAPDVVATPVQAGVPVHETRRQHADPDALLAPLTESARDDNTPEGDLR